MCKIVFEDNHLLVVIKEQNIPTQADSSGDIDLLSSLKQYLKEKYNKAGEAYLGMVHRLDRPTGGVMVFAKTSKCAERLSKQIREGEVEKNYLAVVHGTPRFKQNRLVHYLKKDEKNNIVKVAPQYEEGAKEAVLDYQVLDSREEMSLVKVALHTGRSHQIRVQMATIGHSIAGDVKYGKEEKSHHLALWAYKLRFTHPVTKELLTFIVSPPQEESPWKLFNIDKYIKA